MTCASCGSQNPAGRKFCGECGVRLAVACVTCGAALVDGQKFCGECGAPAVASSAAGTPADPQPGTTPTHAVAERRLVSVLFADLVGFTPFSEERDSEEVREILTRYFDIASQVIGNHGGTVEKFIGDAVMAVWGTPVAREDDAERAVRAALELLDAIKGLDLGIGARAGVLTGEATVTLGATNQGMVAGDIVNTAARIQSVAVPGTVLVGEATFRAASAAIAFEEAGEPDAQGQGRAGADVAGAARDRGARRPRAGRSCWSRRSPVATRSCGCSRSCSTRPRARVAPASSPSPARPASARAASPGSSRSTSTASWTRCGGTTDDRPATAPA